MLTHMNFKLQLLVITYVYTHELEVKLLYFFADHRQGNNLGNILIEKDWS